METKECGQRKEEKEKEGERKTKTRQKALVDSSLDHRPTNRSVQPPGGIALEVQRKTHVA